MMAPQADTFLAQDERRIIVGRCRAAGVSASPTRQ
jgi:hypothetical protein